MCSPPAGSRVSARVVVNAMCSGLFRSHAPSSSANGEGVPTAESAGIGLRPAGGFRQTRAAGDEIGEDTGQDITGSSGAIPRCCDFKAPSASATTRGFNTPFACVRRIPDSPICCLSSSGGPQGELAAAMRYFTRAGGRGCGSEGVHPTRPAIRSPVRTLARSSRT